MQLKCCGESCDTATCSRYRYHFLAGGTERSRGWWKQKIIMLEWAKHIICPHPVWICSMYLDAKPCTRRSPDLSSDRLQNHRGTSEEPLWEWPGLYVSKVTCKWGKTNLFNSKTCIVSGESKHIEAFRCSSYKVAEGWNNRLCISVWAASNSTSCLLYRHTHIYVSLNTREENWSSNSKSS